jgi:hypothetical protein
MKGTSPWKLTLVENKRELVADLVLKAKQIELLIESLPPPEPEEAQVRDICGSVAMPPHTIHRR